MNNIEEEKEDQVSMHYISRGSIEGSLVEFENQFKVRDDGHLIVNKTKLVYQFTLLFTISLILILERIVYPFIVKEEGYFMKDCQQFFGLVGQKNTDRGLVSYFDGNFLFTLAGAIHKQGVNSMLFTNVFITLYVGFDALIAVKIMYVSYTGVFIVSFLQMVYSNPRPFWVDSELYTSLCLQSYANPSSFIMQLGFTLFYTAYCYKVKNQTKSFKTYDSRIAHKIFIIQTILLIVLMIYGFLLFLMALQYIMNVLLGMLYAFIFYVIAVTFENQINNLIKHATIMNIDSKRYVFYISFYLFLIEMFAVLTFSSSYSVVNIKWMSNFMQCLYVSKNDAISVPTQLLMGPKFTFDKTCIVFALIGGLFGVSHCFRRIKTLEWYKGPIKKRIARIAIANLFTIPCWIFGYFVDNIALNHKVYEWGLSIYMMEAFGFLIIYYLLFGLLPLTVFNRLNLNANSSSSYVVVSFNE